MERGLEPRIRAETDLRIRAEFWLVLRAVVERVADRRVCEGGATRRVRHDFQSPRRIDALDPHEVREARYEAPAVPRRVGDVVELVFACDVAPEIDAPHILALLDEPQLGIRDAQLGGPPPPVSRDLPFPHALPGVVVPVVVVERAVVQSAGRIDPEVEAAALVV